MAVFLVAVFHLTAFHLLWSGHVPNVPSNHAVARAMAAERSDLSQILAAERGHNHVCACCRCTLCGCETQRRNTQQFVSNANTRIEAVVMTVKKMHLALTDEDGPSLLLFVAEFFPLKSVEHCLAGLRAQLSANKSNKRSGARGRERAGERVGSYASFVVRTCIHMINWGKRGTKKPRMGIIFLNSVARLSTPTTKPRSP